MQGLNRVELIGNLGRDPELRHTSGGNPVVNLRLAVNTGFGENQRVDWFTVVAWNKLAEVCNQYLAKGNRIFVEGRLQIRQWEGDDGQTRYATEIVANRVLFLDRPDSASASEAVPEGADEIPF
nr:single-stranded DNA-binding protein [Anaerolineae bacterium]